MRRSSSDRLLMRLWYRKICCHQWKHKGKRPNSASMMTFAVLSLTPSMCFRNCLCSSSAASPIFSSTTWRTGSPRLVIIFFFFFSKQMLLRRWKPVTFTLACECACKTTHSYKHALLQQLSLNCFAKQSLNVTVVLADSYIVYMIWLTHCHCSKNWTTTLSQNSKADIST